MRCRALPGLIEIAARFARDSLPAYSETTARFARDSLPGCAKFSTGVYFNNYIGSLMTFFSSIYGHHNPSATAWDEYKTEQEKFKLSAIASVRLDDLAKEITDRKIVCAVDGGYTNKTVFRDKDAHVSLIGRIRKDACLYERPEISDSTKGRKKYYGERLPTPEEIRQDDAYPWQTVEAHTAGKRHRFDVKTLPAVRWKGTGEKDVRLVVVRPLAYRPRKGAKLLYREPAYLLCTDTALPLEQLLQAYLWRWEVEVNFRDEKHVLGVGEAQVRTRAAVENVPAFICASYAFMLLAE